MSISLRRLPGTTVDPLYPDSDGEPVGETEYHFVALWHLYGALRHWYRLREDVHVAGNMLLYYEEGNPSAFRGPDVMVSKGVRGKHRRRSFRTWEEGVVPAVIIEITSAKTRQEDEGPKPLVYAGIGVKEYFMFDPEGQYLRPRLQGFRLVAGRYQRLTADEVGQLWSPELGLTLTIEEQLLRLIDPATGQPLPTEDEYEEQLIEAQRQVTHAQQQVAHAVRQTADAELAAARAAREAARAQREAAQAERETEAERRRVAELEAELARLRASLPPGQTPGS